MCLAVVCVEDGLSQIQSQIFEFKKRVGIDHYDKK